METPKMLPSSFATPKRAALGTFVKTVVTTTTVSGRGLTRDERNRIFQVIAQLRKTRLSFTKLTQLQKKRVRNMQRLVRKKNNIIADLAAQLERRRCRSKGSKYFAVICQNGVLITISGSGQFVRQRVANMCAVGGEQIFCERRNDCARDRQLIAEALAASLGSDVITSAANKRFKILNVEKVVNAKFIVQQTLHNGFNNYPNTH
ncbi:hypothetical protein [Epiphyas postvittana nucleopolyhedrovirus]|uniref:DA26 homolog n=1 Tax=Epiphyas postvittana nucleopolyhedrovirus TaxID=70600 RepID=O89809_NPVEP|nr:hypothetical protein [Epiphyas postvittana nucleopolyhedrovirus]AAC34494.1 DA26 homolog [Epiphyas postvittana nucleopolyhedrovirus]AAK85577.1 unknown [Epiphyas postvittana nucleopolyhedrovirus]